MVKKRDELPIVRNGSNKVMGKPTKHGLEQGDTLG